MREAEREQLVAAYLRHVEREDTYQLDDHWAWETLEDLMRSDPETAWDVLLRIINRARQVDLFLLGGRLGELIALEHERFRLRVLTQLRTNPAFLETFRSVRVAEVPQATRRLFRTAMLTAGVPESELYDRP